MKGCFYFQDGYRDGLEMGEEQTVQAGHDEGFRQSSGFYHLSALRGVIAYVISVESLDCCMQLK